MAWDTTYDIRFQQLESTLSSPVRQNIHGCLTIGVCTQRTLADELIACNELEFIDEKEREVCISRSIGLTSTRAKAKMRERRIFNETVCCKSKRV